MQKIKVAHIITRLIVGGAQENTLFTVELLSQKPNFEVTLISGIQTGPEGSLLDVVQGGEKNYKLIFVRELLREINPFLELIALYKLYRIFKQEKYDVIHTHSSKAGILGRLAGFLAGVKIIIHTVHGLPFHPYQNQFLNRFYIFLEKISAFCSGKIITVCDVMREKLLKAQIAPEDKFVTIYSGIDLEDFSRAKEKYDRQEVRKEYGFTKEDIIITKVARLFHLKGHKYIISIAADIIKQFPRVKFFFIGDGILKEQFKTEIKKQNLEDKFVFAGLVSPGNIPRLLSMVDLVVHCSLREGLARVIPCSLALGLPVVSFNVDGAREVVKDYQTGFLVPPENETLLKEKILEILPDVKLRDKIKINGPRLVDPIFRKEYMVAEIEKLYYSLMDTRPPEDKHILRN